MDPEVTVVLPCLNEEETLPRCIEKIQIAYQHNNIIGEIIVADNGSTDKSVSIAETLGARVVYEPEKGYGNALRKGILSAKGKYIIMGDSDDTYDFTELNQFVLLLRQGYELVMGSRFRGKILPGAMTWSHRYIGNPILSGMLRIFFGGNISDAHCGLRAFTIAAFTKLDLHTGGMEFASEMVIHALKKQVKIAEVPITYYPRKGESKLVGLRDAWRHIRFMLLYSPNYLFLFPAVVLFIPGITVLLLLLRGPFSFAGRTWDIHVAVFASMISILGWQIFNLGLSAKTYASAVGLEESRFVKWLNTTFSLEKYIVIGMILVLIGLSVFVYILTIWIANRFGELAQTKPAIFALTLIVLGLQTIFSAFLTSVLQIKYRR